MISGQYVTLQSFDKLESQLSTVIGTVPQLQDAIEECTQAAIATNKIGPALKSGCLRPNMASSSAKYQKYFGDSFKESWLSLDGFGDYFSRIVTSLTSDKIVREKERWEDEEGRLLEEQKSLAFRHYQSFVATAECSNDIRQSFDKLESQLSTVIGTVPQLQEAIEEFHECTVHPDLFFFFLEAVSSCVEMKGWKHRVPFPGLVHPEATLIFGYKRHERIIQDTSIRNNFHEEGLELHSFVCSLAVKHTDIPIIQMIKADSDQCILHMEESLLKQLRSHITLAQCLKCVGLLKRIGTYTEIQLKVKFLEVRTEWFRSQIAAINKTEGNSNYQLSVHA
eukprot:sb/3466516/